MVLRSHGPRGAGGLSSVHGGSHAGSIIMQVVGVIGQVKELALGHDQPSAGLSYAGCKLIGSAFAMSDDFCHHTGWKGYQP